MLKKLILTIVGLCILVGILAAVKFAPGFGQFSVMAASGASMVFPPEVVTSAPVKAEEWETTLRSTGSLVTVQGVTVSAELAGKVVHIAFAPRAVVAAGA